jgi:hypothetical protein
VLKFKIFIDLDKSNSKIFINYYLEDFKILIKIPLEIEGEKDDSSLAVEKFDISNKIYLTDVI